MKNIVFKVSFYDIIKSWNNKHFIGNSHNFRMGTVCYRGNWSKQWMNHRAGKMWATSVCVTDKNCVKSNDACKMNARLTSTSVRKQGASMILGHGVYRVNSYEIPQRWLAAKEIRYATRLASNPLTIFNYFVIPMISGATGSRPDVSFALDTRRRGNSRLRKRSPSDALVCIRRRGILARLGFANSRPEAIDGAKPNCFRIR